MKKYDNYKDSGIEWIGEIPISWNVKKLKFIGNAIGGLTYSPNDVVEDESNGVLVLRSSNIQKGKLSLEDNVYVNLEISEKQTLRKGDILICSRNGSQHLIGKNICIDERTQGNTFGAFMMIFRSDNYHFLNHFFNSPIFTSQSGLFLTATINQLTSSTLNNFYLALPSSIEEQTIIANYLDQKTIQIDQLIAKKEQFIQLLEEERVAVINQSVTKGLEPNVPMKDSGIEWLGEIPAHWEVKMLKFVTSLITNGFVGPTRDLYYETGVRYIQSLHIKKGKIDFERSPYYVSEEWSNEHPRSILKEGDVLVVQTGAVGEVAMVDKDYEDCNCHALIIVRTNEKLIPVFLLNLLESSFGKAQMKLIETGALHQHINSTKLKDIITIVPPIEEQSQIVRFIEEQRGRIQTIINKTQQEIELLKEYKTALISEVVTGKVDVRNEKLN